MKGWYGNKYGHSLASRGIRLKASGRDLNKDVRLDEIKDYYGFKTWYEFSVDKREIFKKIRDTNAYKRELNIIIDLINKNEIQILKELKIYLNNLEEETNLHPIIFNLLYQDSTFWSLPSKTIYLKPKLNLMPQKGRNETINEYYERIERAGKGDQESLFYDHKYIEDGDELDG